MATGGVQPFSPVGTVTIAASSASASAVLPGKTDSIVVYNAAAAVAFVRVGMAGVAATATDTPVPPGAQMLMLRGHYATTVAVLLASGSGSVYVTAGDGTAY